MSFDVLKPLLQQNILIDSFKNFLNYELVQDNQRCIEIFKLARQCDDIGFDTETNGNHWWVFNTDDIAGISLYLPDPVDTAFYIPINMQRYNPDERNIDAKLVRACIQGLLSCANPPKFIGGNLKFDWHVIYRTLGIDLSIANYADVLLRSHLSHINYRHSVKAIASEIFRDGDYYEKALIQVKRAFGVTAKNPKYWDYRFFPIAIIGPYAALDSFLAWVIYKQQELGQLLAPFGNYVDIEHDMARVLFATEETGVKLDIPYLEEKNEEFGKKIVVEDSLVQVLAGKAFNVNSDTQLRDILYNELGLPKQYKRTKRADGTIETVLSTDKTSLNALHGLHPCIEHIQELRKLQKIKGTYIEGLLANVDKNFRIHTTFNQIVENSSSLRTGRLSSSDPVNLENIPNQDTTIRRAFLPDKEDWYLDYAGQEIRVYTHYSREPRLLKAFQLGEDVHSRTCEAVFKIPYEEVESQRKTNKEIYAKREIAKRIFFGILYGSGAPRVAQVLAEFGYGYNETEARRLLNNLYSSYPKFRVYADSIAYTIRTRGYVRDVFNRRYIPKNPDILYPVGNYLVQGTSSGMLKISTVKIWKHFGTRDYFKNFIHDEIDFDRVPKREYIKEMIHIMQDFPEISIPMEVEPSWSKTSWQDKTAIKDLNKWIQEDAPLAA